MARTPDVFAGAFADRYTIERELGRGATATVYLARDAERSQAVAIKVLRPELAQSVGSVRFLREIKVNERLHHPRILPVLHSGESDGHLFFVLPHMDGGSLRQMLQREKQLPIETALGITTTIAEALDYAHKQGMIHRDVKPENILFTSDQACLADFGIARAIERTMDESTTDTGIVRGTPAYMSPEQASGSKELDGRSDQYSLACVLYEMLAGVPAFIGPSAEAIIAQRFQHAPRDLQVYRPNAARSIEAVILKALSISAADRYATTAEFATALETAYRTSTMERPAPAPRVGFTWRKQIAIASGLTVIVAVSAMLIISDPDSPVDPSAGSDSARVVVFPFEARTGTAGTSPQELFQAALGRWQPLKPVALSQISELMRSEDIGPIPSPREARRLAATLGAGRFVVGEIRQTPTGPALFAEYRDVAGNVLYAAQLDVPRDSTRVRPTYEALADSLVLRGRSDGSPASRPTRHLYATQALIDGVSAKDEWALERADSLLTRATELDPSLARAQLWLAQVRVWRGQSVLLTAAERARASAAELQPIERAMTDAILAMGEGRYPDACATYQQLVNADARSFVGWFGLGECSRRDWAVFRDRASPSGWRYRNSYARELQAYATAFGLLPSTLRGFQAGAYSRLRTLLFTSGRTVRRGVAADGSKEEFLGTLHLVRDSLTLVPFEVSAVVAGDPRANADPRALARSRAAFHRIVTRWSTSFPTSAAAKEAVVISLEMQSDRAAIDSVLAAAQLTTDPEQRLRFAMFRVHLLVKFGAPDDAEQLGRARRLADSLLRAHPQPDAQSAALLAPVAALTGRCSRTLDLLRLGALPATAMMGGLRIPPDVVADAKSLIAGVMMGCQRGPVAPIASGIASRIPAPAEAGNVRQAAEYQLLGPAIAASFPLDSQWVSRLRGAGDYLIEAEADLLEGRTRQVREALSRLAENRRSVPPGDQTPDAALPEAQLMLQLGDTARARNLLGQVLSEIRYAEPLAPYNPYNNVARMGALIRAMALLADLNTGQNPLEAARWARAVHDLWGNSDPALQTLVQRMKKLAGR